LSIRFDIINAMSLSKLFDFLAVRLNGPMAAGQNTVINFNFEDSGDQFMVTLVNGVLHHAAGKSASDADASVRLGRAGFLAMTMRGTPVETLITNDAIGVSGDVGALNDLLNMLDTFEFWFEIVTP
jgi:alkyl sulfatase BDS1-like metallo-beta-lactamase superfamily hydrolase